ncbi:MAG: class I SAM-dependent methyltransferase [Bacteroidota bacterium]|jgi:2-polyprenyl-3-methyl-5-hydroxy-6-metoxy-1,4-benzoquinol methylase
MEFSKDSKEFLEQSADLYHNDIVKGWEKLYHMKRERMFQTLKKWHVGKKGLELGSADGIMTQKLCSEFEELTVIDGSELFLDQLLKKVQSPNIKVVCSLFEEYSTNEKYDTIFMTHILEHLDDPTLVLKKAKEWLSEKGRIIIAVPNANSLHRLIGVKMGMLEKTDSLNSQDIKLGHRRVYSPDLLKQHVTDAGLRVVHFGGQMIKPLSNRQIEEQWSDEQIKAFFDLGDDMPEYCSEIFLIAEK